MIVCNTELIRYNDDVMPRNSMSRYNHGDRMNSYSQYNFKNNDDRGGRRQYRNAEEPEWFSGGPTSQNDTIELRGFEEYSSGRQDDSPTSHHSDDADDDKAATAAAATAAADYDSDTDKANDESEKVNDDNNNDNDKSGNEDANNHRESNANKAANDFDAEDLEVAESKPNKKDDNFNFEDFLKGDNLTDLLAVSVKL